MHLKEKSGVCPSMFKDTKYFQHDISAIRQRLETAGSKDEDEARKISLMFGLTGIGIFFLSLLGSLSIIQGGLLVATLDFLSALILLFLLVLLRRKGYLPFCIYGGISLMYGLFLYLFISGGVAGYGFLWSYTFPLFTFFLLGSKKGFRFTLFFFLSCIVVIIVHINSTVFSLYDTYFAVRFIPSFATVILFSLVYEQFRSRSQQALVRSRNTLEQKVVERTRDLANSEARYRALYDNTADGISIISLGGRYLSANQRFCNRLGYSEEELKSKGPEEIYQDKDQVQINIMLKEVLTNGYAQLEAEQVTSAGIQVPVEIRARRIIFDDHAAVLCSCRDISDRIKREQENKKLQQQLFRASKMEAIGLMAGGIAHDLNNILAGITGYPELLLLRLAPESELRKPIEEILHSGQRATAVVADLLTVARGVASAREPHECNNLIEQFLASPEWKKIQDDHPDVRIVRELDPASGNICCSSVHFQKCIMNLLLNAVEAASGRAGARVNITSGKRYVAADVAGKTNLNAGDYVFIRVHDNGPGIAQEDIEHIYEPFYSKKIMGRSGTGLGLTVVWNVVHEHNGTIKVASCDKGSSFTLYFPATEETVHEPDDIAVVQQPQQSSRILVVDDEPQLLDIAKQSLANQGYIVKTARSGEEALDILQKDTFDLILLDMIMEPGINGRQTYEEILKINPGQKALVISGYSEHEEVKRSLELGAAGLIKKPYSLRALNQEVQHVLAG